MRHVQPELQAIIFICLICAKLFISVHCIIQGIVMILSEVCIFLCMRCLLVPLETGITFCTCMCERTNSESYTKLFLFKFVVHCLYLKFYFLELVPSLLACSLYKSESHTHHWD